jgi:hypothetical protein
VSGKKMASAIVAAAALKWSTMREGIVRMSATALDPNRSYVYGIALPNVRERHPDEMSRKKEYDKIEIHDIDMTGIDMRANHKEDDEMARIGEIVAYEPLENEARVLGVLDDDEFEGRYGEAASMIDHYGSMSLSHRYQQLATYSASSTPALPQQELVTSKTALEVSLCKVPARPGAEVMQVCPSQSALLRQPREFLRRFAVRYNYPLPPDVPNEPKFDSSKFVTTRVALNTPVLEHYVRQTLSPLVQQRLHDVVNNAKFVRNITILPTTAAQRMKQPRVDSGTVKMSANSNSMQTDAPPPLAQQSQPTPPTQSTQAAPTGVPVPTPAPPPSTSTPVSVPKAAGAPFGAAGNNMALDGPVGGSAPPTTTTQSRITDMTLSPDDDPATMALKMAALNEKLQKQIDDLQAKDKAEREKRERDQRELEGAKIRDIDVSAQTAASTIAERLKMTAEERKAYDDNRAFIMSEGAKNGWSADYINKLMGGMLSSTVSASKRAKPDLENDLVAQQRAQARDLYLRLTANKTPIGVSGGYNGAPPSTPTESNASAATPAMSGGGGGSASSATTTPRSYPSYFGLSAQDYSIAEERERWAREQQRKQQEQQQQRTTTVVVEGTVNASSRTATTTTGGGENEEWTPDTPDVLRKVWISGVTQNEDGTLNMPSLGWVARGGDIEVAIEKRSASGEMIQQVSIQPRWKEPVRVGPQHLFPEKIAEEFKIFNTKDANPDQKLLVNMARLGKLHEQRNIIPKFQSRRREPSRNWRYMDKRWIGKEEDGDVVVRAEFA